MLLEPNSYNIFRDFNLPKFFQLNEGLGINISKGHNAQVPVFNNTSILANTVNLYDFNQINY